MGNEAAKDRSQKSEVRSQKSEVRSRKSEVRSQKSEVRSQKSEVRSQKSEVEVGSKWKIAAALEPSTFRLLTSDFCLLTSAVIFPPFG